MYELKHIPQAITFVAIVREQSFSAAARTLGISKSVVSTHLRDLEAMLGTRLLERTTRSLKLTCAGQQFYPHACRMLSAWTEGRELARSHADQPRGVLRVTTSELLAEVIQATVSKYIHVCPNISVDLIYSDSLINIVEEQIDVAIRGGPLADSRLIARPLLRSEEVIVAHPGLAREWSSSQRPEDLNFAPWIAHRARLSPAKFDFYGPNNASSQLAFDPRMYVSTATGLVSFAKQGVGFAVVPATSMVAEIQANSLVWVLPGWRASAVTLYAVYVSRRNVPKKTTRFLKMLDEEISRIKATFPEGLLETV